MSGDNGLMSQANRMLSREARLEDLETVARLLAEIAALRAKDAAADRVRELLERAETQQHRAFARRAIDNPLPGVVLIAALRHALDGAAQMASPNLTDEGAST